jgi:hypothetical protein
MAVAQPQDVPQGHWAYDSVAKLAAKGLVVGYPDGSFVGKRVLTRYEMACIVARILDRIDQVSAAKTESSAAAPEQNASVPEVTKADLEAVGKLVDEYKIELTVMGTRIDKVESAIAALEEKVASLDTIVNDEEGPLQSTKADVAKLKKVAISGYNQIRYQTIDFAGSDNVTAKKQADTFLIRRARLKITAQPNDTSKAVVEFAADKNSAGVKDAYYQYIFGGNELKKPSFYVGQMLLPFGYDNPTSSSVRETPEQSIIVRRFFPGERDQGAKISSGTKSPIFWQVGVFNGTGTDVSGGADKDTNKAVVVDLKKSFGDINIGASYYSGNGIYKSDKSTLLSGVNRVRYGANMQCFLDKITLKAEYIFGRGVDFADAAWNPTQSLNGYNTQLNYNINPTSTLVARYQSVSHDPLYPSFGSRSGWDLGIVHWMDSNARFKLFYEINNEQHNAISNNGWAGEWIITY